MAPAVSTRALGVSFTSGVALAEVSLDLAAGQSLAVVGANGSGKSTLLGALAGLHRPSAGSVEVPGATAYVLQATEIADGLPITVRDAVKLARYPALGLFRRFTRADHHAVDSSLERMKVAHLAKSELQHLSGGQRQRVLLAQGLAQQGEVLLLDEPMTGLDLPSREVVLNVIAEELHDGRAVVMTTHSLTDAAECDLTLLLATKPVAFGPTDDVLTEANLRQTFGHRIVQVGDHLVIDDHHVH